MTTEQFEQQLLTEAPVIHYLTDTVADFLLNRGHPAKIGEIANQVGKSINASAKLIRQVLAENPQFIGEERRWNLALRMLFHRPIEGALQQTLLNYGRPMTIAALSNEMAVLNARPPEFFQSYLPNFMAQRPQHYFQTPDGRWALAAWLLDTNAQDEEELLMRNFFNNLPEVEPLLDEVRAITLKADIAAGDAALKLLDKLGRPLTTKVISFALWRVRRERFDPVAFFLDLLQDERFHLLSGGEWAPAAQFATVAASLQKLSVMADATLEEEEAWEGPYSASEEDMNEVYDFVVEHSRPQKLSDIIETVLEYSRTSPRYESVFTGMSDGLQGDPRFQLVGQQTWTLPVLIPQEVLQVPEALLPETLDPSLLPDPETDAELEDEGLEGNLALWVHDPRYEDFGGEHEVELSPELMSGEAALDETRIPLLYDHHAMGTLKLRQADMSFFPTDTPLACVTMHGEQFGTFQIWVNNEELLIHGLADWYMARKVPVGAVLTVRRGDEPDDFLVSWDGEIDGLIALSEDRVAELLEMRDPADAEHWSTYEIMRHVLAGHAGSGAHFLTIWAEVNVIRRTPKRVVASNLSSYHCFALVSNTENWRLDERKVDQGRKKTKKKYVIE
ncbi:MAG: hypothetical protein ACYC7E_20355 [Armatimonadota bacterium]